MKFYRGGEEVGMDSGRKPDEVAFEAPCAHCQKIIPVSAFTAEIVKICNRICATRNWAPITRSECALCSECYPKHRQKLVDKAEWELQHSEECWKLFKSKWGRDAEQDADMERQFARDFPWRRSEMRNWIAAQKNTKAPPSADAAAGFGRKR